MLVKIQDLTLEHIASICDHTFLNRSESYREKAQKGESPVRLRQKAFETFISETLVRLIPPYAICIRAEDVSHVKKYLEKNKSKLKIAATVGFPDGSWYPTRHKLEEAALASDCGADEIDFVLNYDLLKKGNLNYVLNETAALADMAFRRQFLSKMILETSELNNEHIIYACNLAYDHRIDFVKTSTGFSSAGATPENLKLMRENFPGGVKISGGVKAQNYKQLLLAASGRGDDYIDINPLKIRIGESSLLAEL